MNCYRLRRHCTLMLLMLLRYCNGNKQKKYSTEWLMNVFSIHLSVSIRANRIKIYCEHYTQNATFNYNLHTHIYHLHHTHTLSIYMLMNRCKFNNGNKIKGRKNNIVLYTAEWSSQKMEQRPRWLNALLSRSILGMKY